MPNPLFTAISGLTANQAALSVIGNNIANSNTVGFKTGTAQFQNLLSQQFAQNANGAGEPLQIGLGVNLSGIATNFQEGSLQQTNIGTNAAIVGNGMFVLNGPDGQSFSRAGNFTLDNNGFLVNPNGLRVQGFTQVDANGKVVTSGTIGDVKVPVGVTSSPTPTTAVNFQANLDASATSGTTFNIQSQAFDSLGGSHILSLQLTRDATGNSWTYEAKVDGNSLTPAQTGSLTFDANGKLTSPAPDATGSPLTTLTITGQTLASGAALSNIKLNLVGADGTSNITGFDAPSATTALSQNGAASGVLTGIAIGADGTVQGVFSNGKTNALAQLATASFNNYDGLSSAGNNLFNATAGSGQANIGAPGTGSRGSLAGSEVESSNVDLPTEFTNLLVAQRGFQANSRTITTSDEVLQDVLSLIH